MTHSFPRLVSLILSHLSSSARISKATLVGSTTSSFPATASSATAPSAVEFEESDSDFSVRMDNESSPGLTVVEIQGVDQENLLVDVLSSFSEMGIRKMFINTILLKADGSEAYYLQSGMASLKFNEDPRKRADLLRYVESMDQPKITAVIRIFYLYASLLNVADEAHSHRQRREQVWASQHATPLWYASFEHTLRLFKKVGVSPKQLQELLDLTEYSPVFTAHPTEARRREILTCLHRILICACLERFSLPPVQSNDFWTPIHSPEDYICCLS